MRIGIRALCAFVAESVMGYDVIGHRLVIHLGKVAAVCVLAIGIHRYTPVFITQQGNALYPGRIGDSRTYADWYTIRYG
jgi:hypothetical protein